MHTGKTRWTPEKERKEGGLLGLVSDEFWVNLNDFIMVWCEGTSQHLSGVANAKCNETIRLKE